MLCRIKEMTYVEVNPMILPKTPRKLKKVCQTLEILTQPQSWPDSRKSRRRIKFGLDFFDISAKGRIFLSGELKPPWNKFTQLTFQKFPIEFIASQST